MSGYTLGLDPTDPPEDVSGPPDEIFLDAESLGQVACTSLLAWGGVGSLLVLTSLLHPDWPRTVTVTWSSGESAIIRDIEMKAPGITRQLVPRPSDSELVAARAQADAGRGQAAGHGTSIRTTA